MTTPTPYARLSEIVPVFRQEEPKKVKTHNDRDQSKLLSLQSHGPVQSSCSMLYFNMRGICRRRQPTTPRSRFAVMVRRLVLNPRSSCFPKRYYCMLSAVPPDTSMS